MKRARLPRSQWRYVVSIEDVLHATFRDKYVMVGTWYERPDATEICRYLDQVRAVNDIESVRRWSGVAR